MTVRSKSLFAAAALAAAATPLFAWQGEKSTYDDQSKEGLYARMHSLAQQIEIVRERSGNSALAGRLLAQYEAISSQLGGDDPAQLLAPSSGNPFSPVQNSGAGRVAAPSCPGSTPTTTNYPGTTGAIPDTSAPVTLTTTVSTLDTYLWDLNLNTSITHTENADLDIRLASPAGTVVVVTTDNGGANDNVFNGTLWDDNVNLPVTDAVYANLVVETPVSPEGRFQAFRGEDPNGTWTLTVFDDLATDTGSVAAWSLDISTLSAAPTLTTTTVSDSPALAILDVATVSDSQAFASADTYLTKVVLYTEITHTFAADLDLSLTSPALTTVIFSTDNGGGNDDVFNGTSWDPDALNPISDEVTTNLVVLPLTSPEGSFDNFLGQDPNGSWTINITDDAGGDIGVLARWDLTITTASAAPTPSAPVNYVGGGTPAAITDPTNPPAVAFTSLVSGAGTYLWNPDLNVAITHTACADLDMTLSSPAGTVITVSTDNGGLNDNVFNGTLWDAQSTDATTDHVYVNATVATPLSPEGSFDAFRGENPNGTWTLTIDDDFIGDAGTLNSWSLDVTSYPSAPSETTVTVSQSPGLAILDVATVSDTMVVGGMGTQITEVILYTEITHTFAADMDIYLTSPALTTIAVTTDNGGGSDNVFNGTSWDPDSTANPTDYVYTNLVVAPLLSCEGSAGAFIGQDPNGSWVLTIVDDLGGDVGTLVRWDLTISTCQGCVVADICEPLAPDVTDGCTPDVSWTGTPDVGGCTTPGTEDFFVTFSAMSENKNCNIIIGKGAAVSLPWATESNRCFPTPYSRTGAQDTGDVNFASACGGEVTLDVEGYLQGGNPLLTPVISGDSFVVQAWYRDPGSTKTTQMSDAASFTVCP